MGDNYARGIACYQTKQYKLAEKEFRQEVLKNPDSAAAHAMLGMTLYALKKYEPAHTEALAAVQLLPYYAYGHYTLSYTFYGVSKPKEAEKAIIEAIRIEPEEAYLFARASQIYFNIKKYPKALEMADLGLACDASHEECLINRGASLLEMNRLDEAEVAISRALEMDPENYTAHINQGAIKLRKLEHVEAFRHYREALRLNPNSEQARLGVIESLKAKNRLYHGLLRFSVFCRSLPPWAICCSLLLLIIPVTRFLVIAAFGIYTLANHLFELALHLDPVGKDFVSGRKERIKTTFKEMTVPLVMVIVGVCVAVLGALSPTHDKHYRHRSKSAEQRNHILKKASEENLTDFSSYMANIEMRIKSQWHPAHVNKSCATKIQFLVDRDGNVSESKILETSGSEEMDATALRALKDAAPLPKLPPTKKEKVEVQFTFAYNHKH